MLFSYTTNALPGGNYSWLLRMQYLAKIINFFYIYNIYIVYKEYFYFKNLGLIEISSNDYGIGRTTAGITLKVSNVDLVI